MGTHINRVDQKGRASIPAPFRALLRENGALEGPVKLVLRPSHKFRCLEAWSVPAFDRMLDSLEQLATYSDDHDDLATALAGSAKQIDSDAEGRISLPPAMAAYAGITDNVAFVGHIRSFRIWEPAAAEQRQIEANQRAFADKLSVPAAAGGLNVSGVRPA